MANVAQAWAEEAVRFYRPLEFFQGVDGTDAEIAQRLLTEHAEDSEWASDEDLDPEGEHADFMLLARDQERVYWNDMEADVCNENRVYEEVLADFSRISRGTFRPENVRETWESEEGPVYIEFDLSGRRHRIDLEFQDDWIDMGTLLTGINDLLPAEGPNFVYFDTGDQTAFIAALTPAEAEAIRTARSLRLERYRSKP